MVTRRTWEAALEDADKKRRDGKVISALNPLQEAAWKLSAELEAKHRLKGDNEEVKVVHYTSIETIHVAYRTLETVSALIRLGASHRSTRGKVCLQWN